MPKTYEMVDIFICLILLTKYVVCIFCAPSRYDFFISWESIKQMVIIFPVLIFPYECAKLGLFFKAVSRMVRIYNI